MNRIIWGVLLGFSVIVYPIDLTLNTQLDEKLDQISKKEQSQTLFKFNVLRSIEIKGLNQISEDIVRNELMVFKGDILNPYVVSRNLKRIKAIGYFDDVESQLIDFEGGKKWVITVKENPIVNQIVIKGNDSINSDVIIDQVETSGGEVFNFGTIRTDILNIEDHYKSEGFLFTKVSKVDLPTYQDPTLVFYVEESQFDSIDVSGNTKTKDYVILREIDIKTGDKVNEVELKKNLGRVFNLNYFSEVVPDLMPSPATKNAYDLLINVKEKSTDSINVGGGWGQQNGGFLYSDLNINNFLGTGQLIALRGQWGGRVQTYQFKYFNPWMFGERRSLTYRAWNTKGSFGFNNMLSSGYRPEARYGMDVAVGLPHSYELRSTHKAKIENVYVSETDSTRSYSIQSYAYSLSYDTRDIKFSPLNGVYHFVTIENGFKLKSNALQFTRYDASFSKFFQTAEKQTIATRLMIGKINGNIEVTEYYYIGGPNTVRGYIEYPYSFGFGRSQLLGNVEYRFLLSDIIQFLFFVDAGWASSMGSDFTKGKVGKGVGFRINSPLGPIRIDFGIDELGEMRTHFNIGHIF
jgi:outer membrane protein insertion porin family